MKRAVFLDRDGVLNRSNLINGVPTPPNLIEDVEILAGVVEAIRLLKTYDFVPVVVTNQPDVARGTTSQSQVQAINSYIGAATDIQYFYTCFHDDGDCCDCRKPAPGLIHRASKELGLLLQDSFMVGDRWRDISAGQSAGCQTFFIDYSYAEKAPKMPFKKVSSLLEAAQLIIGEQNGAK
jgi:D-glycero-D-manno-heptose 1,7-bisphosphate phosphatase